MTEPEIQGTAESTPGLTQGQRIIYTFTDPSKTFEDIRRGNKSWWLPLILYVLAFAVFFLAVSTRVTWNQVYQNEQRNLPEFAKRMQEQAPPERQAAAAKAGPITQAVTAAIAPAGVLLIDVIGAAILLATINFGFGGKAKFSSLFVVTLYAGLPLWVLQWLLGAITACFTDPEAFNIHNASPTNVAAFLPELRTSSLLVYNLLMSLDALGIWCMVVTSIGVATVAGVKRNTGYIVVFGWWVIGLFIGMGVSALMG